MRHLHKITALLTTAWNNLLYQKCLGKIVNKKFQKPQTYRLISAILTVSLCIWATT